MSKMDRILNSKKDKQMIYEIYRACRLCGAGAGYKMPIVQNVVDSDDTDVELKQKIRECVQIEVHQDDKMPPLICELCVDKVNDFYEFLEMCRQTNKRTRLRLGLPPQSMPRGAPDAGECILGVTEPVYVNEDSDGEPLAKHKKLQPKVLIKKEPDLKSKEKRRSSDSRPSRQTRRSPTPPRITRHRNNSKDDNMSLSRLQDKSKSQKGTPKSILKKEVKTEDNSLLTPRLKRSRDKDPVKFDTPVKKVKIIPVKSPPTKLSPKTSPRSKAKPKPASKRAPSPVPLHKCSICGQGHKTAQATSSHMKIHVVSFTSPRLACNPCGDWFSSAEEARTHHLRHRGKGNPYSCRRCSADFRHLSAYDEHFEKNQCIPYEEVPDVKCEVCWHLFPTNNLLESHKCMGEDYRPGGKCPKCRRNYTLLKNLKKHEQTCTAKKKGELVVDPELLGKLKPMQVRISRCDALLTDIKQGHYDVSRVTADFGLDKNCVYPYISSVSRLRIKSEPGLDKMVAIEDEIKDEFYTEEDYVHWDSEDSSDDEISCISVLNPAAKKKNVATLANLTLKTLFSQKCLGKVPRKRRRVKQEESAFDSLLNETEDDVMRDISNIVDNLGDDDDFGDDKNGSLNESADVSNNVDVTDKSIDVSDEKIDASDDKVDASDDKVVLDDNIDLSDDKIDQSTDKIVDDDKNDSRDNKIASTDDKMNPSDDNIVDDNNKDLSDDFSEVVKDKDESVVDGSVDDVDKESVVEKDIENTSSDNVADNYNSNDVSLSNENDKNDLINAQSNLSENIDSDVTDKVSTKHEKDVITATSNDNSVCNENGFNINLSSVIDNNGRLTPIDDKGINDSTNNKIDVSKNVCKDENQNEGNDVSDDLSLKNDVEHSKNDFESQDSNSVGSLHESLLNDNTQSDVVSENEKENVDKINIDISDNATSLPEHNSEVDENKSQADEFSIDNLSQDSKLSDVGELKSNLNDGHTDRQGVIVNNDKNKNSTDSDEIEDAKLMANLDAAIGESTDNQEHDDKIALEDLLSAKTAQVDTIPDEFNFDA